MEEADLRDWVGNVKVNVNKVRQVWRGEVMNGLECVKLV